MYRSTRLSLIALAFAMSAGFSAQAKVTKEEIDPIIKEYLAAHPEEIMDSLRSFQLKQQKEAQMKSNESLKTKSKELYDDKDSPSAGAKNADVTVVEFFDYHCGYCKKMVPALTELLKNDSKVRVVFKEYPILSPDSEKASQAAVAVFRLKPEKYFDYHAALMSLPGKFDEKALLDAAEKVGISGDKLKAEMEKPYVAAQIKKTRELASALSISGTPAFVIGDKIYPGAMSAEDLKKMVDEARKAKK